MSKQYRTTIVACAALLFAKTATAQGVIYRGLSHTALGNARLTLDPNDILKVSNIGSSGLDGVSIAAGGSESWSGSFLALDAAALPGGAWLRIDTTGVAGGTGLLLSRFTFSDIGTEMELSADFPFVGSPPMTVYVFDGETLQAIGGSAAGFVASFNPGRFTIDPIADSGTELSATFELANSTAITLIGGPTVTGDRIVITAPSGATVSSVTQVDVLAAGVGSFGFEDETIGMFGSDHRGLGQATLSPSGTCPACTLTLGNIGASGDDGVEALLDSSEAFSMDWEPLTSSGPLPNGASLMLAARGSVDGVPDSEIGQFAATDAGSVLQISADFAPIGAVSRTVQVYNNGSLVAQVSGLTASIVATLADSDWPDGFAARRRFTPDYWPGLEFRWQSDVVITLTGGPTVTGDLLRAIGENPTAGPDSISAVPLNPHDIPELVIVNEGPEPTCPGDLDADGEVGLSDLATLIANYGTMSGATYEDGDLDGDEDVDLSDLGALLAVYGNSC